MAQLTKGVYGGEFSCTQGPFGLRCGQMRGGSNKVGHNAGWYNRAGEKLGFGDLNTDDLKKISEEIEGGELFITLGEQDSFWNFVTKPGMIGSMSQVRPDVEAPGVEYVAAHARFVIGRGKLYYVPSFPSQSTREINGLLFACVGQEDILPLLTGIALVP